MPLPAAATSVPPRTSVPAVRRGLGSTVTLLSGLGVTCSRSDTVSLPFPFMMRPVPAAPFTRTSM